jgi:phosphomannomutase
MVTASHNPPQYNGIKLKGPHGGPVFGETLTAIESRLGSAEPLYRGAVAPVHLIDPDVKYLSHVAGLVDLAAIRDARLNIVVDCMHGAGRMYLRRILQKADIRIRQLHGKPDPTFGGVNPEPLEANLATLKRAVAAFGADVGLATDGDGDRLGAFDHRGRFVNPHEVFALILSYLVEKKGLRGGVAKTFSTTRMIDRLAQAYDLPVYETPVGFKHISELFLAEDILVGGEESGGLGVKGHLPERDCIVTALLLLEAMARQGKSLATLIAELFAKVGPHHYRRLDIHLSAGPRPDSPGPVPRTPPPGFRLAGHQVTGVSTLDGTKYQLGEAGWILFRSSGTEPVVRVYVEATTEEDVDTILGDGARLVRSAF